MGCFFYEVMAIQPPPLNRHKSFARCQAAGVNGNSSDDLCRISTDELTTSGFKNLVDSPMYHLNETTFRWAGFAQRNYDNAKLWRASAQRFTTSRSENGTDTWWNI